jgi:NAD(P)-dependent dehydrogenase (short-subunit alcohol dehydrogenase family)
VSKEQEIVGAFERIRRELGDPDVLLYNAAMRPFGTLMDTKPSTFENTWRVSSFGAFLLRSRWCPQCSRNGEE